MKRLIDRAGWALAGALGLMLVLVAARAIQAGPLDPPGPVASTLKTLGDVPPSWHQILPSNDGPDNCHSSRLTCVLNNEAVLDHETGLVWQRTVPSGSTTWAQAASACDLAVIGGRGGWRLPSPDELSSLNVENNGLPTNHPFSVSIAQYWSSQPSAADPSFIVTVNPTFSNFFVSAAARANLSGGVPWCVRGGNATGIDAQSPFPNTWTPTLLAANDGATLTNSSRFRDFGNPLYVTDQETGLLWQVTPAATTSSWAGAVEACARFNGTSSVRLGWRLPTLAEQLSLYTSSGAGALPTGHPFAGITGVYWTSTTSAADPLMAYTVDSAAAETSTSLAKTTATPRHWCVRGGPGD